MIKTENGKLRYFDKNGREIVEGSMVRFPNGSVQKILLTDEGELGTDATSPSWIEAGKAFEGQYGVYPLSEGETNEVEVVA